MISIIVPAYNIDKYISRCIESIIRQTYQDWELIVVDDGSTDCTWSIITEYANKDQRIKPIYKENGGVSAARNLGLDNATGDYISFVDGDDWLESTLYEDAITAIKEHEVDIFMFEYFIDKGDHSVKHIVDNSFYGIIGTEQTLIHSIRPHNRFAWSKVFSSKLLLNRQNSLGQIQFDSSIILGEDTLFIIEVILNSDKTYYTDKAYYHYDQREGSAVRSSFNEKKLSGLQSYKKICDLFLEKGYCEAYEYGCGSLLGLGIQLGKEMLQSGNYNENVFKTIKNYINPVRKRVLLSKKIDPLTRMKACGAMFSIKMVCALLQRG